jgi:hypothetical protein
MHPVQPFIGHHTNCRIIALEQCKTGQIYLKIKWAAQDSIKLELNGRIARTEA